MSLRASARLSRLQIVGVMAVLGFGCWLEGAASVCAFQQQSQPPADEPRSVEIVIPGQPDSISRMTVRKGDRRGLRLGRSEFRILNPEAAGDFTGIEVEMEGGADNVAIRLTLIYNELPNQGPTNDTKEKLVGNYVVRAGEPVYPIELAKLGVEPFEIRLVSPKLVDLLPGRDFRVTNQTSSLEVVGAWKILDRYTLILRNTSAKHVVAYKLLIGPQVLTRGAGGLGAAQVLITAGAPGFDESWHNLERDGLTIGAVIFQDDRFEGDLCSRWIIGFIVKA